MEENVKEQENAQNSQNQKDEKKKSNGWFKTTMKFLGGAAALTAAFAGGMYARKKIDTKNGIYADAELQRQYRERKNSLSQLNNGEL